MRSEQPRRSLLFPKYLIPSLFPSKHRPPHTDSPSTFTSPSTVSPTSSSSPPTQKYLNGHLSYLRCTGCAAHLCLTSQIISKGFTGRHGRAYLVSAEPVASALSISASSSPTTSLPNTIIQHPVPRQLVTGAHTVSDVTCAFCGSVLGWKYVAAEEESQRYKVGKFILETKKITASTCWEGVIDEDDEDDDDHHHYRHHGEQEGGGGEAEGVKEEEAQEEEEEEDERRRHRQAEKVVMMVDSGEDGLEKRRRRRLVDDTEFDSQDDDECEDLFTGIWSPGLASRRRSRKIERRPAMMFFGMS